MQALCDQFLAGAALADHQHRPIERRRAACAFDRIEEGSRLADELIRAFHAKRLADFPICWQVLFGKSRHMASFFRGFSPFP
jgi:hypothetical protein